MRPLCRPCRINQVTRAALSPVSFVQNVFSRLLRRVFIVVFLLPGFSWASSQTNLIFSFTGTWRYQTNILDGQGWEKFYFNDAVWPTGNGCFYIESAILPVAKNTPLPARVGDVRPLRTYYFRKYFFVYEVERITSLIFSNLVDDGAVYYLNGVEIKRLGMPGGVVTNGTFASREVGDATTFDSFSASGAELIALREGLNVIAVEVHQATTTSSDVVFDCNLSEVRRISLPTISAMSPVNGETNTSEWVKFWLLTSGTQTTNFSVTLHSRAVIPRPDFTLAVLGDTQFYTSGVNGGNSNSFIAQTEWIVANRIERNIVAVTHLGDCVNYGDFMESEWWIATNALYRLEDAFVTKLPYGIPYSVAVGNHDGRVGEARLYNRYFGVPHFSGRDYFGGHYGTNNNNHYVLFSASGLDFILLEVEFAAGTNVAVMNWANEVLQAHRDRRAIVVSHSILRQGVEQLQLPFNAEGQPIYESLKDNTNIFLMLCGHDPQAGRRTEIHNRNLITILRSDYENETNGGNGWMRMLEFSPSNSLMRVKTYSPTLQQYRTGIYHQFSLPCELEGFKAFSTITNVASGFISLNVTNAFPAGYDWEWYAEIHDAGVVARSPVARFRTDGYVAQRPAERLELAVVAVSYRGEAFLRWNSIGGRRYRLEVSDGNAEGGFGGNFREMLRSESEETDPAPTGTHGTIYYIDDFTVSGPPTNGARFYRLREIP